MTYDFNTVGYKVKGQLLDKAKQEIDMLACPFNKNGRFYITLSNQFWSILPHLLRRVEGSQLAVDAA